MWINTTSSLAFVSQSGRLRDDGLLDDRILNDRLLDGACLDGRLQTCETFSFPIHEHRDLLVLPDDSVTPGVLWPIC